MTKQGFGISAFWLKLLAIAAMTVDHIGYLFYPGVSWMRMVGRLTFPIMAFLIAEGYRHTHDLRRYETRLFVFALISMLPFYLAFGWVGKRGLYAPVRPARARLRRTAGARVAEGGGCGGIYGAQPAVRLGL